jgi:hypothetical protein
MSNYKILSVNADAKTKKGNGDEYLTGILYMAPFKILVDGKTKNSCPMAEQAGCVIGCLNTAGRGQMNSVQAARLRKAEWFYRDRDGFMRQLYEDITKFSNYCFKRGIQPCVRLNGTTDIRWELIKFSDGLNIFEHFSDVQFYDYTKIGNRNVSHIQNYHLTWSYSGAKQSYAKHMDAALSNGMNVAVVFRNKTSIPAQWRGLPTLDGDKDDLRFKDPASHIVALYAKGAAKRDTSGFVVDV